MHACSFRLAVRPSALLSRNLGSLFSTSPKLGKKQEAHKGDDRNVSRLACVRDAPEMELERMKVMGCPGQGTINLAPTIYYR